jgi:UDP-glucose 4-epimerase
LAAEGVVATSGLDHGIARLANVYGPGQRSDLEGGVVAILTDRLRDGQPVEIHGSGRNTRDLVHVDDVVNAVLEICGARATGTWSGRDRPSHERT